MPKVLVFGTFDQLHPGHLYVLNEAKKHGELYVVLAREETIKTHKGFTPKYSEQERKQHLETTGIPDNVVLGNLDDKYQVLSDISPDVICLGYDQNIFVDKLQEELDKRSLKTKIIRLQPHKEHIFKSSKLKL